MTEMSVFNDSIKLYLRGLYLSGGAAAFMGVLAAAEAGLESTQNWGVFYGIVGALCVLGLSIMLRSRQKAPLMTVSQQGITFAKDETLWHWEQIEAVEHRAGVLWFTYTDRARQTQKIEADALRPPVDDVLAKLALNIPEKLK